MNQKLLALACVGLATLAIAGCKPRAPAEPAAEVAPAVTTAATGETAPPAAEDVPPAVNLPALDRKGFAGTFTGGTSTITLDADGTFGLKDGKATFGGTWTAEADGARIRLDPDSKAEPDRLYAVVGNDEIRPLDEGGQQVDGANALQRETRAD